MPHDLTLPLWLCLAGIALLLGGTVAVRRSGAQTSLARHLAGARQRRVGELRGLAPGEALPERPIRVAGRVRCQEPAAASLSSKGLTSRSPESGSRVAAR